MIYIYFKRGFISNEQFSKDLVIIINIENLNSTHAETFDVILEEMILIFHFPLNMKDILKIIILNLLPL